MKVSKGGKERRVTFGGKRGRSSSLNFIIADKVRARGYIKSVSVWWSPLFVGVDSSLFIMNR